MSKSEVTLHKVEYLSNKEIISRMREEFKKTFGREKIMSLLKSLSPQVKIMSL